LKKTFADTSFLVSLYQQDANTEAAVSAMRRLKASIWISSLVEVELMNALELRVFRKQIDLDEANAARIAIQQDLRDGILVLKGISAAVYETSTWLSRKHTALLGIRCLDLIHVATAIALGAEQLCSFDRSQWKLALAEGLAIVPKPTSRVNTNGR
jgi:predicted nucleic acid-binding protein